MLWLHSLKVAQLLRSAACVHTNQSGSYLNHLVLHGYNFQHSLNRMAGRMEDNTRKCAADANIRSQMTMWSDQSMGLLSVFSV